MKVSNLLSIALSLSLTGCAAQSFQDKESVQSKIRRFKGKEFTENKVPRIPVSHELVKPRGRSLASVSKKKEKKSIFAGNNKSLYFITLYGQYLEFQGHSAFQGEELRHCPSFHSLLVDYKSKLVQTKGQSSIIGPKRGSVSKKELAYYPELTLPVTKEQDRPIVYDMMKSSKRPTSDHLQKALSVHSEKMMGELRELCEFGSGNNYYIFENLITHIKSQKGVKQDHDSLKLLGKTTLVSNMILLKSLQKYKKVGRGLASSSPVNIRPALEREALARLGAPWVTDYLKRLKAP